MLEISQVEKSYGAVQVLRDVSLEVQRGEIFTLLGASGCGKTTLLRMIAGLDRPDEGRIAFDGATWADGSGAFLSPQRRGVGLVFQSYAIWPHLSVFDQVAYPLRSRGTARREIVPRVTAALKTVGMAAFADRSAQQLSGGQQQRVAMARALVAEPALLLLDEPFSNLDVALRDQLRMELRQIQRRLGITIVLVTHDQADAFSLSDRIAVMRQGVVEQVGSPEDIYERSSTAFVRSFVGRSSRLSGTWSGDSTVAVGGDARIPVMAGAAVPAAGAPVSLLVRPQDVRLVEHGVGAGAGESVGVGGATVLPCRVLDRLFVGDRYECLVELPGGQSLIAYQDIGTALAADVGLRFDRLPEVYPA